MKDKKSFILYADQIELFEELSDEDAGQLIKHVLRYVNDLNPETSNPMVKISFIPIKQHLKRDLKRFESIKKKRSDAGKKSAELRAIARGEVPTHVDSVPTNPTHVKSVQQTSTNPTVSDNDNDNDNVNDIIINDKNTDDVFFTIESNIENYLKNYRTVTAVLRNQKNNLKNKPHLKQRLEQFGQRMTETGVHTKTWNDFTSHFLNWNKKTPEFTKSSENGEKDLSEGIELLNVINPNRK
ncbi:MAG: DUF6291 domain-containing protein [Nitrosopumilus sp.]